MMNFENIFRQFFFAALWCSLTLAPSLAQDKKESKKQLWQGTLDVQVAQLRLNFEVSRNEQGKFSGTMTSVDQGNITVPLSKVEVNGDDVLIEVAVAGATFTGKLNADQTVAKGKWKQGGREYDFEMSRVETFAESGQHIESWKGTLEAGAQKFDFQLRIFKEEDDSLTAKLDSFSEGLTGLPVGLTVTEEGLTFEVKISAGKFEGKFDENKNKLDGHWLQGGGKFPLSFEKIALAETRTVADVKRPQNPKKPYPYDELQVTYENRSDQITLAGTLTTPKGDGPFPAVILISGSGAQDRDETIFQHKPFWVIADHLTRNGIAVLRYDERGVGKSTGTFSGSTSEDFARDVEAGIDFLKQHSKIDAQKIGLIGHSEGGLIAPMIAAKRDDVALIVMLAGPGVDGAEIGISQSRAMAEAAGASEKLIDAQENMLTELFDVIKNSDEALPQELIDKVVAQFESEIADEQSPVDISDQLSQRLQMINNPWFRYFVRFDPQPVLKQVKCPVLALNGKKDLQVLVDLNVDAIQKALSEGGNRDFEVHKLESLNHLFQTTDGTGLITDYGRIEETFSPVALDIMSKWILERTNN